MNRRTLPGERFLLHDRRDRLKGATSEESQKSFEQAVAAVKRFQRPGHRFLRIPCLNTLLQCRQPACAIVTTPAVFDDRNGCHTQFGSDGNRLPGQIPGNSLDSRVIPRNKRIPTFQQDSTNFHESPCLTEFAKKKEFN